MLAFVPAGLDVAAITKLVVETVREKDDTDFTHHSQTLEMGTTKVQILDKNLEAEATNKINNKQL